MLYISIPIHITHLPFYSTPVLSPPEVSPILTKTKTPLERAPLIKITGKVTHLAAQLASRYAHRAPILIQICGYRVTPKEQSFQFSKAPIMKNFGELEFGEIPEPLKFVRPFRKLKLPLSRLSCVCRSPFSSILSFLLIYYK